VILFGLGECFQGPVQGALVADLAPPRLRGRYMAVSTNSWDLGFLLGPAIGGFILAASRSPSGRWPRSPASRPEPERSRWRAGSAEAPAHPGVRWVPVTGRDARLEALDFGGEGPGVLLLHGLAGTAAEWEETAAWLSETHRVVALDQRGHGRSERRPGKVTPAAYVADALAAIEILVLAPAILVGQSLGGLIAFLAASERPDLVDALIVVEATPTREGPEVAEQIADYFDSWPLPFHPTTPPSRSSAGTA
jgi:MFS family permease